MQIMNEYGLSDRQEKFVQSLLTGKTQRQSYKDAGYKVDKLSNEDLDSKACNLFNQVKIKARYYDLKEQLAVKIEKKTELSVEKIVKELSKLAFERDDIKESDKIKSIELLGKHLAMFTEKLAVSGEIEVTELSVADKIKIINEIKKDPQT